MSLHYILDGYNILNKIPSLSQKDLEGQRLGLLHLLDIQRPQGSIKNRVTIVFDGKFGIYGNMPSKDVRIIFSKNESADDVIIRLVRESGFVKDMVVVSDDRDIQSSVRSLGASIATVKDFLSKAKRIFPKEYKKNAREERKDSKYISKSLEFKITEEFEKIWLKSKKH